MRVSSGTPRKTGGVECNHPQSCLLFGTWTFAENEVDTEQWAGTRWGPGDKTCLTEVHVPSFSLWFRRGSEDLAQSVDFITGVRRYHWKDNFVVPGEASVLLD